MTADVAPRAPAAGAQAVRRAATLLRLLAGGQEHGVRLVDLAHAAALNRPTVHRILRVLMDEGMVEQDTGTRRYRIGPEVPLLGLARRARAPICALAAPHLKEICRQAGDTVFLSLRTRLDSVCVDRCVGAYPLQVLALEIGARRPLGIGVSGVAMLGALPEDEASVLVQRNAARLARHGLDAAALEQAVRRARAQDHAYATAGIVRGTRAIAVAVRDPCGAPIAAISIAAMPDRLDAARLPSLVELLREQSALITRRLAQGLRRGRRPPA